MKLNPSIPPGRSNRKARAYSVEITRLWREGYGCKAIRQALLDAGASVSKSTVQRELARLAAQTPPRTSAPPGHVVATPVPAPPVRAALDAKPTPIAADHRPADGETSARDFAASFMKGRHTNPFIRNRS